MTMFSAAEKGERPAGNAFRTRQAGRRARRFKLTAASAVLMLLSACLAYAAFLSLSGLEPRQAEIMPERKPATAAAPLRMGRTAVSADAAMPQQMQAEAERQRRAVEMHSQLAEALNRKLYIVDEDTSDGFYDAVSSGVEPQGQGETPAVVSASVLLPQQDQPDAAAPQQARVQDDLARPDASSAAGHVQEAALSAPVLPQQSQPYEVVLRQMRVQDTLTGDDLARTAAGDASTAGRIQTTVLSAPVLPQQNQPDAPAPQQAYRAEEPDRRGLVQTASGNGSSPGRIIRVAVTPAVMPVQTEAAQAVRIRNVPCQKIIDSMDTAVLDRFYYVITRLQDREMVLRGAAGAVYHIRPTAIRGRCMEYAVQTETEEGILHCEDTSCAGG